VIVFLVPKIRRFRLEIKIDPEKYPNGRFALLHDPEGNPIELWEPKIESKTNDPRSDTLR
jgi:hypothetical protein